jgi:hypothetical protein
VAEVETSSPPLDLCQLLFDSFWDLYMQFDMEQ